MRRGKFALLSATVLTFIAMTGVAFAHNPSMMGGEQNQMNMGMSGQGGQAGPMMGHPMMGRDMMDQGEHMGPMMGHPMMGWDMTGSYMMGPNMMGSGGQVGSMMGATTPGLAGHLLSVDDAKERLEQFIGGNKRLKVGKVEPSGDYSFAAEVTTQEGALVYSLLIDRRNGMMWETD